MFSTLYYFGHLGHIYDEIELAPFVPPVNQNYITEDTLNNYITEDTLNNYITEF